MVTQAISLSEITQKWCPDCQALVDCGAFGKDASHPSGLATYCLEHKKIRSNKSREKHKDARNARRRETQSWRKYKSHKLDRAGFEKLRAQQKDMCACCGRLSNLLVTDHNHGTGQVRGLLCRNCNLGIGYLGDNIEGVLNGLWYLLQRQ